jgi:glycogen synthase
MRVLHITTEYPPIIHGGLGTAVGGLVAASARGCLQVAVLLVGHGDTSAYDVSAPELTQTDNKRTGVAQDTRSGRRPGDNRSAAGVHGSFA